MIIGGLCQSAYLDFVMAVHQPQDRYMIALYGVGANVNHKTTAYIAQGEIVGEGYKAGGTLLKGYEAKLLTKGGNAVAYIDWDDPQWENSSIKATAALIYNASKGNKAVTVLDFGKEYISGSGLFIVVLPEPGDTACVAIGDEL